MLSTTSVPGLEDLPKDIHTMFHIIIYVSTNANTTWIVYTIVRYSLTPSINVTISQQLGQSIRIRQ